MQPVRILVADDHEVVRRGVCALLGQETNFEVVCEAADGVQAVAKAKELQPDLIVLDISMPDMDGFAAARLIRKVLPGSEIVFLSQQDSVEVVRQAFQAGARGYVVKSDIAQELITALRAAIHKKHYLNDRLSEQVKRKRNVGGTWNKFLRPIPRRKNLEWMRAGLSQCQTARNSESAARRF